MAITNQDFQVKLHMHYGKPCVAVFWYHKYGAHQVNDSAVLAEAFDVNVANAIADMANTQTTFTGIEVINLVDMNDYTLRPPNQTQGLLVSTSPSPPFVAYKFQLVRTTRAGRHGWKRFPGVSEELIGTSAGSATGLLIPAYQNVENYLTAMLQLGGNEFFPGIPQRDEVTLPDGTKKYVLVNLNPVVEAVFRGLTTQNTRKS